MPYGLYISAEGAHAQDRRLQVLANNLANVDTVGFKRELATFQARYAESIQEGRQLPGSGSLDDIGGGVMVAQTQTDYSQGSMKRTKVPTDMAIEGPGFFVVQKDGQQMLTRAGNFRLMADGSLVTQQGWPVLNDGGSPVILPPENGTWTVNAAGTITQQGGNQQNLAIVQPAALSDLSKEGENLFRASGDVTPLAAGDRRMASGYLEQSGVNPTTEMVQLIEASRILEANLNIMRAQDQMLGGLVSRVLRA